MISEFSIMAIKNLKKRKLRVFLTLLGIVIAVTTIFLLISVSLGLQSAVEEQFKSLGSDKFFIQPRGQLAGPGSGGAVMLTQKDVDIVKKVRGVEDVSAWVGASTKIKFKDEIRYIFIVGVDLETTSLFSEAGAYKAEIGRLLKVGDTKDIMIGSQYKNNNFFKRPVNIGDKIEINNIDFKVQGILLTVGNPADDRLIYLPLDEVRILFNIPERVDTMVVKIQEGEDIQEVAKRTQKKLDSFRNVDKDNRDFTILTPEEVLAIFGTILNVLTSFLLGVAAISLLVGGIGIANTMYTSVLERTKEIGVMKSIGAKNSDIVKIFLIESSMLGLLGGIIGVLIGISSSYILEYIATNQLGTTLLQASTPPSLILGCLIFAIVAGAISGSFPAYQATKDMNN
jgi:putative ABC transport system permease protein